MTNKERMHAALEGKPVDRMPVTVCYNQLYQTDHFAELTEKPTWQRHAWCHAASDEHVAVLRQMQKKAPFETIEPEGGAAPRADREATAFEYTKDGFFRIDKRNRTRTHIEGHTAGGHASDYAANETQKIFDKADHTCPI